MFKLKKIKLLSCVLCCLVFLSAFMIVGSISAVAAPRTVYLKDGGTGDGSTSDQPLGDFKEAVRVLADGGGKIVICGVYTYTELINLSEKSGTSNGNNTITVTSVDGQTDYRVTEGAELRVGDRGSSANMILAGQFVFENLTIITNGSEKARAIICNGYDTVFGEGILCKKQGKAPYISVVGVSLGEIKKVSDSKLTIKSGTYNDVCAGNRDGILKGNTSLIIEGGTFEGRVSCSGINENGALQTGECVMSVFGGYFYSKAGALTDVMGGVALKIEGGIFRGEIISLGKYNTVAINGGNMQNLSRVHIAEFIPDAPETDEEGKTVETQPADVRKSIITINYYNGDVKKLADKINAVGVELIINTKGGSDADNLGNGETGKYVPETGPGGRETGYESSTADIENGIEREYILGSKSRTVVAVIALGSLMLLSALMLTYRSVYRKK